MSPLLFALSSQPLMGMLTEKTMNKELMGLKIFDRKNLLYQLFADDVGIFLQNTQSEFETARETIQIFENILGAFLNIAKPVIIPLSNQDPQISFDAICCQVLCPNETTSYLGCLICYNISPT